MTLVEAGVLVVIVVVIIPLSKITLIINAQFGISFIAHLSYLVNANVHATVENLIILTTATIDVSDNLKTEPST